MIDPSIILRGAEWQQDMQQRNMQALQSLGGNLRNAAVKHAANNLLKLGTPEQQQEFIKNSRFAPELTELLAAKQKTALDTQKTLAEIGKITAESGELGAKTGKLNTEVGGLRYNTASQVWQATAEHGVGAGKMLLAHQLATGAIDQSTHDALTSQFATLDGLALEDVAKTAFGQYKATLDPKYNFTTADNVLDNTTSRINNSADNANRIATTDMNNKTQIKTTGMNNDTQVKTTGMNNQTSIVTNAASNAVDLQRQHMEQNKGELVTGSDGNAYIFYPSLGKYERYLGADGKPVKGALPSKGSGMSPTIVKELFETDDAINSGMSVISGLREALTLNDSQTSYDGVGALGRAKLVGNLKDSPQADNTVKLDNIVIGNALNALKATFGAAPTEGERKILVELQGSVNLPANQRKAIYDRAIVAADRRLKYNQSKAAAIRAGTYTTQSLPAYVDAPSTNPTANTSDKPNAMSFFK